MLRPKPPTAATSGVRVSCRPRRTPVVARTTSIAGMPIAEIRRYVTAWSSAASEAPKARHTGSAASATTAAVTAPRPIASQVPSMPAEIAPVREPAPSWRATTAVVPYARKTKMLAEVSSTALATPRPARAGTPSRPTIAASARRKSGSATRARKAGTARRSTSRCWPPLLTSVTHRLCHGRQAGDGVPAPGRGHTPRQPRPLRDVRSTSPSQGRPRPWPRRPCTALRSGRSSRCALLLPCRAAAAPRLGSSNPTAEHRPEPGRRDDRDVLAPVARPAVEHGSNPVDDG